MTWQIAITLQVFVSSLMTLFTRHVTLSLKKVFFAVGLISYLVIALMGFIYSVVSQHGLPAVPTGHAWLYLVAEGIFIPAGWLTMYKIIGYVGAGNAVIINTFNTVSAALFGIVFLHEVLTMSFVIGALLVFGGVYTALQVKADTNHRMAGTITLKALLILSGALFFGLGMLNEKLAINAIGVWNYAAFGWAMQAVGALALLSLFGRHEIAHISHMVVKKGAMLGFVTSIAGGLFIYALSKGSLSATIIASSGKIAITLLLAALFFNERNAIRLRVIAFILSAAGLWLIVH